MELKLPINLQHKTNTGISEVVNVNLITEMSPSVDGKSEGMEDNRGSSKAQLLFPKSPKA